MPELPDLEVFSHNLNKQLAGLRLKEVNIKNTKKLTKAAPDFNDALAGQKISKIYRVGKELYFKFGNDALLSMHLMLNGELQIYKEEQDPKYAIAVLCFKNGIRLALSDFRGLARIGLNPEPEPAPDALSKQISADFFEHLLAGKKGVIKNVLLDQQVIKGIGNAYADEILWEAGISPFSVSGKIPPSKWISLAKAVRHVLENAVKQISKLQPGIITGEVRDFLKIHHPEKKHSPSGVEIQVRKTGGRKTYFTAEQELYS